MYAIKTSDKQDGASKIYFENTLAEAEELAAPLRKAFNVEIVEIEDVKKPMVFVIKEEYYSYNFPEESGTDTIGIFTSEPSDEIMAYFATKWLHEEQEYREATLIKDEDGNYVVKEEEGEYTFSYYATDEIAFA